MPSSHQNRRGGKKDCYGCKDQLMIKRKKNLSTAWIDYKKAFPQYTPFLHTQMPPDVKDPPSTYNIHRRKHEPMED